MEIWKKFRSNISMEIALLSAFQFFHGLQLLFLYLECVTTPTYPPYDRFCIITPFIFVDIIIAVAVLSRHLMAFAAVIYWNLFWLWLAMPSMLNESTSPYTFISLVSICILILLLASYRRRIFRAHRC